MYYDYDIRNSEEYPQGAFCKCGVTIHLKDEELISGYNIIKCPKCGKEVGLFTSALKEIPSDLLVMSLLYLANEDSLKELIKENGIYDGQGKD